MTRVARWDHGYHACALAQHQYALSAHYIKSWLHLHRACLSRLLLPFLTLQGEVAEQPSLSLSGALAMLTGITVIVAFASECALLQHRLWCSWNNQPQNITVPLSLLRCPAADIICKTGACCCRRSPAAGRCRST
jgi:hypothetical protein